MLFSKFFSSCSQTFPTQGHFHSVQPSPWPHRRSNNQTRLKYVIVSFFHPVIPFYIHRLHLHFYIPKQVKVSFLFRIDPVLDASQSQLEAGCCASSTSVRVLSSISAIQHRMSSPAFMHLCCLDLICSNAEKKSILHR